MRATSTRRKSFARLAERVSARFGEGFAARVSLARDRALAEPLAIEIRPVAEALLEGLAGVDRVEPSRGELREALAMASLLGRRAATLGATPTGALAIVPLLLEAASEEDPRAIELMEALRAVCMEGYVATREESVEERAARRVADAIPMLEAAPGCFVIAPAGVQDADQLERVMDDAGRRLLERDARACVIDASGLREPDPERARRLFAIEESCRMLGVTCIFAGVDAPWLRAARDAGLDVGLVRIAPDFATALALAFEACGLETRPKASLSAVLRRFVGRN